MVNIVVEDKKSGIVLLRISNGSGAYAEVTNIGASVVSVVVPDKNGVLSNVVLGYEHPESYLTDKFYIGSTIGRYANRISGGRFTLDGEVFELDRNDGENSNHGGFRGLNRKIFRWKVENESIVFEVESPHGEGGFPGNLRFEVRYTFDTNNCLRIEYRAVSDRRTPVNFTNHSYFDLGGATGQGDITGHLLRMDGALFLESDSAFLPTGRILSTPGTEFDFSEYTAVGSGINTYFIARAATIKEPGSGRVLNVRSSMPGILLYTGDYLSAPFSPLSGVCLEAQYMPDAMNHTGFEVNLLNPGEERTDWITYAFGTEI